MRRRIVVGIPIYQEYISKLELVSLIQADRVLSAYKKVFIAPCSLSFNYGFDYEVVRFPDIFFRSTDSYSELLMRREFYQAFAEYDYLLIYQLDAFAFYDSLQEICRWGYDYIGAPIRDNKDWQLFHVGNGGLSLRKVAKCEEVVTKKAEIINRMHSVMMPDVLAEDVFFGYCGWDKEIDFRVPCPRLASRFSVQSDYVRGMRDIKKRGFPFGCHYWWRYNYDFWKPYIEKLGYKLPDMETPSSLKGDSLKRMMYLAKRRIVKEWKGKKIFAVYGGGVWGRRCVEFLRHLSIEVKKIYDMDDGKNDIYGIPVAYPYREILLEKDSFIVIATLKYEKEVSKMLMDIGLKKGEDFCSIYEFCRKILKEGISVANTQETRLGNNQKHR